jgi:hypothetical protein
LASLACTTTASKAMTKTRNKSCLAIVIVKFSAQQNVRSVKHYDLRANKYFLPESTKLIVWWPSNRINSPFYLCLLCV